MPPASSAVAATVEEVRSVPEEEWRRIEGTLGLGGPSRRLRNKLTERVIEFERNPPLEHPRPALVRKWLSRVLKDARRLQGNISIDDCDYDQVAIRATQLRGRVRDDAEAAIAKLIATTERRLSATPKDKGGAPSDEFMWSAIYDLATVYYAFTRRRPTITFDAYSETYRGKFLAFVEATFTHLAPRRMRSNQALGKLAQRVLAAWKRKHRAT